MSNLNDPEEWRDRRARERAAVLRVESTSESSERAWFIVAEAWLAAWRSFINVPGTGPPRAIDNGVLLQPDGRTPRQGLRRVVDYRGVNARVWAVLVAAYGGGPAIPRATIDIYSVEVRVDGVSHGDDGERRGSCCASNAKSPPGRRRTRWAAQRAPRWQAATRPPPSRPKTSPSPS